MENEPKEYRICKIAFDKSLMEHMLQSIIGIMWKQGRITFTRPLPEDISIYDINYDRETRQLELYLESETFDLISEGGYSPLARLVIHTLSDYAEEVYIEE